MDKCNCGQALELEKEVKILKLYIANLIDGRLSMCNQEKCLDIMADGKQGSNPPRFPLCNVSNCEHRK